MAASMERTPAVAGDGGTHVQGGRARSLELIAAVDEAFSCGDWPALRRLYHDDALLCTVAAHERLVGPDELMEVFAGLAGTVYSIGSTQTIAIDDNAVVVSGAVAIPTRARRDRRLAEGLVAHVRGRPRLPVPCLSLP